MTRSKTYTDEKVEISDGVMDRRVAKNEGGN
jgi:hypothetical protein